MSRWLWFDQLILGQYVVLHNVRQQSAPFSHKNMDAFNASKQKEGRTGCGIAKQTLGKV
jgi:hypothetical protein